MSEEAFITQGVFRDHCLITIITTHKSETRMLCITGSVPGFAADGQCNVEQGAHNPQAVNLLLTPARSYSRCSFCHGSHEKMTAPVFTQYSGVPQVEGCYRSGSHIASLRCLYFCPGLMCCTQRRFDTRMLGALCISLLVSHSSYLLNIPP